MEKMHDLHEAYQVLVGIVRAKNTFIKKMMTKKDATMKTEENTLVAARMFKKKVFERKL